MKILFICNEYPPAPHGGIGSFTKLIAENLILYNHDAIVVGNGVKEVDYSEEIKGVKIIRIRNKQAGNGIVLNHIRLIINRIQFFFKVQKQISLFNPDIVESYDWNAPLIFKPKGALLVTRLHGSNTAFNLSINIKRNLLLSYLERKAIQQSDYIVSVSNYIGELTKSSFNLNFQYRTIYNGVDTIRFCNQRLTRDNNELLLVGRMHPNKGFDELFKALNYLFGLHPTVKLKIICTVIENFKNRLLSFVDPIYNNRIIFYGRVPNDQLEYHYNIANLLILPSKTEALPIIPLESMACGTPVIMADRFSSREIIYDGVDGFLINTNDPEKYALKIFQILEDQETIDNMRSRSREKVLERFSVEKIIVENIQFYQSIIKIA